MLLLIHMFVGRHVGQLEPGSSARVAQHNLSAAFHSYSIHLKWNKELTLFSFFGPNYQYWGCPQVQGCILIMSNYEATMKIRTRLSLSPIILMIFPIIKENNLCCQAAKGDLKLWVLQPAVSYISWLQQVTAKQETRCSSVDHWWKRITTMLVNILHQSGQLRWTLTVSCRAVIGWWMEAAIMIQ